MYHINIYYNNNVIIQYYIYCEQKKARIVNIIIEWRKKSEGGDLDFEMNLETECKIVLVFSQYIKVISTKAVDTCGIYLKK